MPYHLVPPTTNTSIATATSTTAGHHHTTTTTITTTSLIVLLAAIECTRPTTTTGYAMDTVTEVLDVPNFAVTFTDGACATGYAGTPAAAACSSAGEYTLSGCAGSA